MTADGAGTSKSGAAWPVVALAVVVAALVRIVVLRDLLAADPLFKVADLDDRAYLDIASAMARGERQSWFLAPLYPWLVSAASSVFAPGMALACGVDAALGALAAGAAAAAGCALHSRAAGVVAGLALALLGAFVFCDVAPGQETALTLLHLVAVVCAARFLRDGHRGAAAAFGVCVGVAVIGRATSTALLLLLVPAPARGRRLTNAAFAAIGLAVVLLPAAFRNLSVAGDFTPLPWSGGPNLYAANGPDARRSTSYWSVELSPEPEEMARRATAIARADAGGDLTPGEVSSWWTKRAWRERGGFGEMASHLAKKAALFWSVEERGSSHSPLSERAYSPFLRVSPVHAWWLLALGLAGWWIVRPGRPAIDGAALVVAGTWLALTIVFPLARYRLPAAAVATVIAACAAVEVARRAVPIRRLLVGGALFVAATVVAFLPIRESSEAMAHVSLAAAHMKAGDGRAATDAQLREALDVEPNNGPAHELTGRLLLDDGDAAGALDHFLVAAKDSRARRTAQTAAIPALVALGRTNEATGVAEGLLRGHADDPELLANAALAFGAAGNRDRAASLLASARRLSPEHPAVRRAAAATGL